ncbi:unnamed protein product [Colias eurytheme]|nr:unnamed protein product [Colias eurytheme]
MPASNVSLSSSKREKNAMELTQEIESVRALNSSLRTYLENLRQYRKNLSSMNENCKQLREVNTQWIDTLTLK